MRRRRRLTMLGRLPPTGLLVPCPPPSSCVVSPHSRGSVFHVHQQAAVAPVVKAAPVTATTSEEESASEDSDEEEEDSDDENGERDSNGPDTAVATSQLRHFVIQVRWHACNSVRGPYTLSGISGNAAATRPGGGAARGRIEADCQPAPWSQSQHVATSGFTCYSSAV